MSTAHAQATFNLSRISQQTTLDGVQGFSCMIFRWMLEYSQEQGHAEIQSYQLTHLHIHFSFSPHFYCQSSLWLQKFRIRKIILHWFFSAARGKFSAQKNEIQYSQSSSELSGDGAAWPLGLGPRDRPFRRLSPGFRSTTISLLCVWMMVSACFIPQNWKQ